MIFVNAVVLSALYEHRIYRAWRYKRALLCQQRARARAHATHTHTHQREANARRNSIVAFREQRHVNVSKAYWMSSLSLHPFARGQSTWRVHSDLLVQTKMRNSYERTRRRKRRKEKTRSSLALNIRAKKMSWLKKNS